jgi:hypothetical protein
MMRAWTRIVLATLVGCAIALIASILQPHFKAGSFPDLVCELVMLPGGLFASLFLLFHYRGNASPEFLWCSRLVTAVLYGGLAYWISGFRRTAPNKILTQVVVIAGLAGTAASYAAVWLALHIFVPGLILIGFLGAVVSGLILAAGTLLASRTPRQNGARSCALFGLAAWAVFFVLAYVAAK